MNTITSAELHYLLTANPNLTVLDVRTPAEFAQVHVEQAINIPLDDLNARQLLDSKKITLDRPVYLLCHSGQRAKRAAEKLTCEGHNQAIVVEGGTVAWVAADLPVIRGKSNVISLERQVRIGAGSLVLTGVLLGWLVHPAFVGLSGFVGAGLVFAGITDWCGLGLLIAKAPWNRHPSP